MHKPVRCHETVNIQVSSIFFVVAASPEKIEKVSFVNNEPEFRWALLQDQMAFDKLHEGIKKFAEDGETLRELLKKRIAA